MTDAPRGAAAPARTWRPGAREIALLLLAAFALRLAFGVTSDFWGDDEHQIYLIGLKYFTTGVWPDFGPDVVYTHTQVPGALQGLLIAAPLWLVGEPEAPYVLLNLLSFGALTLLAWYIGRRLPDAPRWFLWTWTFFSPWTLDVSTHVYNPSYVLTGAVVFFVGAFELTPVLRCGVLPRWVAGLCMGFGLLWVAQLHLSVSLLVPIAIVVFVLAARERPADAAAASLAFAAGAAIAGATLVPTFVHVGVGAVLARTSQNLVVAPRNLLRLPQIAAQFMSFATFEIARFIGANTRERLDFLRGYAWAAPFAAVAAAIGLIQAASLIVALFWRPNPVPGWNAVRWAAAWLLGLVYVSFAWSVRTPASHTFYVALPVVMIYAFYVWTPLFRRRAVRITAALLLACGFVTHAAVAVRNFSQRSLYVNRALIVRAIREKNYHLVGERRSDSWK